MQQVTRQQIYRLLELYRNTVYEKFPNRLPTPAALELMQRYLSQYQSFLLKTETNPLYSLPVRLTVIKNTGIVDVELDPQAMITILD